MADEAKAKYEVQVKLDVDTSELDSAQQRLARMPQGSSGGGAAVPQQMAAVSAAADDARDSIGQVNTQMERVGRTDLSGAENQVNQLGESADQAAGSFVDLASELEAVGNFGESLKGVSAGIVAFGADAVQAAGEFEQLRAKLVTIQHDAKTASDTFNYAKTLAAATPFDVQAVVKAAVQLEVYGQKSRELLPVVANLASAMGGDISHAATAMGKALSGSADGLMVLRDSFGINTDKLAKFGAELNAQGGIAVDSAEKIDKLKQALVDMVNTEFAGGIERQAATVDGALGNLEDEITNAKAAIGDELSPYVKVLTGELAKLVEGLSAFAPAIAVIGGLAAAVTGVAGAFITGVTGVVAFKTAMDRLDTSITSVNSKLKKFKAENATLVRGAMFAGISTAVIVGAELLNTYVLKYIEDQKKLQAQMADESKQVQAQRQVWNNLQKAIEATTGAKVDFYGKKGAAGIGDIAASDNLPTARLLDELEQRGTNYDAFCGWVEEYTTNVARLKEKLANVKQELARAEQTAAALKSDPKLYSQYTNALIEVQTKKARKAELETKLAVNFRYTGAEEIAERIKQDKDRIDRAQKGALASVAYADYAERTKDTDLLFTATERLRKSLASLYEAAKKQTLLSESALKDPAERMNKMADLVAKGQTNGQEYKIISGIQAQAEAYAKAQEALEAGRQERYSAEEQRLDETFAREQAGRDQDLAAERKYYEDKLALHKDYRQALAQTYESELKTRSNGWLPGEKEALQQKYEATQHLSAAEVECINKLHELDKNQAAEKQAQLLASLQSMITPLSEAAQELSSSLFADPDDTVAAYELCIRKLKEWAEAHKEVLAASQEVQSSYAATLKAQEQALKQAIDNRGNKAYQTLQEQAQTQMVSAKGPVQQLNAVRQTVILLQQALKTNKDIKASESARYQVQQQIVALGKQELSIKEQIKQMSEQLSNENDSLDLQLKQDELSDLEERSQAGENVYQALIAKEQEIHQMRLADIEEEAQKELESVKGQAELEEQVIKKLASMRQLEENRYQRELRSRSKDEKAKKEQQTAQTQTAASADRSDDSFGWKPGSPLMTPAEAFKAQSEAFLAPSELEKSAKNTAVDSNTTAFDSSTAAVQSNTAATNDHATGVKAATDVMPGVKTSISDVNTGLTACTQALKAFASAVKAGTDALGDKSNDQTKKDAEAKKTDSAKKADSANKTDKVATTDKAKPSADKQSPAPTKRQGGTDWDKLQFDPETQRWVPKTSAKDTIAQPPKPSAEPSQQQTMLTGNTAMTTRTTLGSGTVTGTITNELRADSTAVDTHTSAVTASTTATETGTTAVTENTEGVTANTTATETGTTAITQSTEGVTASTAAVQAFTTSIQAATAAAAGAGSAEGAGTDDANGTAAGTAATATGTAATATGTAATATGTAATATGTTATTAGGTANTTTATGTAETAAGSTAAKDSGTLPMSPWFSYISGSSLLSKTVSSQQAMPIPDVVSPPAPQAVTSTVSTANTTNNYYIDSVRSAQSVDSRALAQMVDKVAGAEQRRIRTMLGG